jgi:predicted outer membrane repeat protein
MNGGTIAGNQAVVDGGGIRLMWTAQAIINDGVISGNTAGTSGGGIYVGRETSGLTVNGGTILGNTAGQAGGGVYVTTVWGGAPSFTMTGGTLEENRAGTYGGGVYIMDGGIFTKQPPTPNTSSGVIYGYDPDNPSSNKVQGGWTETDHGHAVYVANGPKKRETTVGPDQHLDSAASGGWAE